MDRDTCTFCLEGQKVYKDPYSWSCDVCGMNGNDEFPVLGIEEIATTEELELPNFAALPPQGIPGSYGIFGSSSKPKKKKLKAKWTREAMEDIQQFHKIDMSNGMDGFVSGEFPKEDTNSLDQMASEDLPTITQILYPGPPHGNSGHRYTMYQTSHRIKRGTLAGIIARRGHPLVMLGQFIDDPKDPLESLSFTSDCAMSGRIWHSSGFIEINWGHRLPPMHCISVDYARAQGKKAFHPPYKWKVETTAGSSWVFYTTSSAKGDAIIHLIRAFKLSSDKIKKLQRVV